MDKKPLTSKTSPQPTPQLVQSEQYASIGQLVTGVAHEINNPLGYIDSNLSTLQQYWDILFPWIAALQQYQQAAVSDPTALTALQDTIEAQSRDHDLSHLLDEIPAILAESRQGTHRIQNIVQSLKMFSDVRHECRTVLDLKKIIDGVLEIVTARTKYQVEVEKIYDGDPPALTGLPQSLGHVLINIILNAVQAMPDGGKLTIRVRRRCLQAGDPGVGRRQNDPFREGNEVVIVSVTDTGAGIAPDIRERIFEPFFTTRDPGQGSGLGLSIAQEIVQRHQGWIDVVSTPGQGSCFAVYLPLT